MDFYLLFTFCILVQFTTQSELMGGHYDNKANKKSNSTEVEDLPKASALIHPGYNLPAPIFNNGKPFYVEKDPLTGAINFNNKTSAMNYDYFEEEELEDNNDNSSDLYDKSNIDRKDGGYASHRPNDVNQLSPNFHDFLNLPVKYNPEKYVYPLISGSYANTKIQGNVNNNYKYYSTSTRQTTVSPHYYQSTEQSTINPYQHLHSKLETTSTSTTSTTTPIPDPTENLLNSPMNYPENDYEYDYQTISSSTNINTVTIPTVSTKKPYNFFDDLFGDYEEVPPPPPSFTSPKPEAFSKVVTLPTTSTTLKQVYKNKYENDDFDYNYNDRKTENKSQIQTEKSPPLTEKLVTTKKPYLNLTRTEKPHIKIPKTTTRPTTTTTTTEKPFQIVADNSNKISITSEQYDYYDTLENVENESVSENHPSLKVTSMPLGENHPTIISLVQNAKETLNREKIVEMDKKQTVLHPIPSTSNIRIAPDQDMVSFVVGNHQNVEGGHFIGSALKEEPYISDLFQPFHSTIIPSPPSNLQPIKGNEASLSIGIPANDVKTIPGQVVDEDIEYPNEPNSKVVFPNDDLTTHSSQDILSLYSKPMLHQLPADLTPPSEPVRPASPRPPWDPRPGHFYQGRPEYARPPRPHKNDLVYKRVDGLPNILPQFRPNAKVSNGHYNMDSVGTINAGYIPRQPLLDRTSNRPIGFFEKLHPPPLPHKQLRPETKHDRYRYEERILNVPKPNHFATFQKQQPPPAPALINRKSEDDSEISTLQMIQSKQTEKLETLKPNVPPPFQINYPKTTEKPLYVVYPVNSSPLKLDVLDNDKKETVVVGTRGEQMPLPPSKIQPDSALYDQTLLNSDRNDFPILKPQTRPTTYPIKSDFPYMLERPDLTLLNSPIPSTTINTNFHPEQTDQISVTLKTFTSEKPIAIAYTPTEKYSAPNFGRPVISEIRPENDSEFTVSAVMHTHNMQSQSQQQPYTAINNNININHNHKFDDITSSAQPVRLEFQAPFQASVNVNNQYNGWSVVNNKKNDIDRSDNVPSTNLPETSSEFDIENFKPQLFGGFKPIYTIPSEQEDRITTMRTEERQE